MSLNNTPSGERLHIGFFGMRNAGKSSVVNAVTNQELSVVSDVLGTTTDPVKKAMELLPLGPVVIIDTPGLDDEGTLGEMRVQKAKEVLAKTDVAILVVDATKGKSELDEELLSIFRERKLPHIVVYNKIDLISEKSEIKENEIYVSATAKENIDELKELIAKIAKLSKTQKPLVSDLLSEGDLVVLVIPIDEAAPKGRLILPQQMVIRDILDHHCMCICTQVEQLSETLNALSKKPKLVITDSQAFGKVAKLTPDDITMTSFSILMARYKGDLETLIKGASCLSKIKDGDKILISEGCTHHRQCNDIGTVKMPKWIEAFTNAKPQYTFTSGTTFPDDLNEFKLIVHCGGCMLNEKEMKSRMQKANAQNVPILNYGVAIAHMHGILKRSLAPFPDIQKLL
ncbi:MAG: [Ruminococcus sp.]|nr:[FeFe] hydrogenase H-cluster maturation GTPase HydF [Ruminococcus sp.]